MDIEDVSLDFSKTKIDIMINLNKIPFELVFQLFLYSIHITIYMCCFGIKF